jgi:hypothetical protein
VRCASIGRVVEEARTASKRGGIPFGFGLALHLLSLLLQAQRPGEKRWKRPVRRAWKLGPSPVVVRWVFGRVGQNNAATMWQKAVQE